MIPFDVVLRFSLCTDVENKAVSLVEVQRQLAFTCWQHLWRAILEFSVGWCRWDTEGGIMDRSKGNKRNWYDVTSTFTWLRFGSLH